ALHCSRHSCGTFMRPFDWLQQVWKPRISGSRRIVHCRRRAARRRPHLRFAAIDILEQRLCPSPVAGFTFSGLNYALPGTVGGGYFLFDSMAPATKTDGFSYNPNFIPEYRPEIFDTYDLQGTNAAFDDSLTDNTPPVYDVPGSVAEFDHVDGIPK